MIGKSIEWSYDNYKSEGKIIDKVRDWKLVQQGGLGNYKDIHEVIDCYLVLVTKSSLYKPGDILTLVPRHIDKIIETSNR